MTSGGHGGCWSCSQDSKGIRRGGGGLLPLNCTVASLSSDTVHVVLRAEHLAVAVALDISGNSSEVLSTVCGGPEQRLVREKFSFETLTYFHEAVQEICLARMLYVLAVVYPLLPHVRVMVMVSVDVAPNSVYTKSGKNGFKF